jgi:hypothetical protein
MGCLFHGDYHVQDILQTQLNLVVQERTEGIKCAEVGSAEFRRLSSVAPGTLPLLYWHDLLSGQQV